MWKTIHGLSNRAPSATLNTSITFSNKTATTPKHIANCFTKQFTNTVKHATHKAPLKHIGPLGLPHEHVENCFNTSIIPHIWKLANIVPIPKPNKDIDKGTSYRPISLLSVIAKTLEISLLLCN